MSCCVDAFLFVHSKQSVVLYLNTLLQSSFSFITYHMTAESKQLKLVLIITEILHPSIWQVMRSSSVGMAISGTMFKKPT